MKNTTKNNNKKIPLSLLLLLHCRVSHRVVVLNQSIKKEYK